MARSGRTAQEFIQNSFSPVVAVLCSPKVENITAKNNLSFTELLQPFTSLDFEGRICKIVTWYFTLESCKFNNHFIYTIWLPNLLLTGQIREPSGGVCVIKNWKLIVRDVHWKPLPPTEARKQLNNAVLHNYNDKTVLLEIGNHNYIFG